MKRVYAEEKWCLGCHLCEYNCAFANSGGEYMALALKDKPIYPRVHIEETDGGGPITYAVQCRHCTDPLCVRSCISGALTKSEADGVVRIDHDKCIRCFTCMLVCPYGAISKGDGGVVQKCELCLENTCGAPACVSGCPNNALIYEER